MTQEYICAELTASKIENHLTPADKNKLTQWRKRKIKNGDDVINKFVTDNRIRHNCPAAR